MGRLSRVKWCLLGCLIVGLVFIGVSVVQPGRLTNVVKLVANSDFAYKIRAIVARLWMNITLLRWSLIPSG